MALIALTKVKAPSLVHTYYTYISTEQLRRLRKLKILNRRLVCMSVFSQPCTAKNATHLMQVVDFPPCNLPTSRIKPVDFTELHQVCEHQTSCSLIFAQLLQVDATFASSLNAVSQLAAILLTKLLVTVVIKPEKTM